MLADLIFSLLIIPLALIAISTLHRIEDSPRSNFWLMLFTATLIIGGVVGYWFGFKFEYRWRDSFRIIGCPLPVAVFHLEEGEWYDFVPPCPLLNALLDLVFIALLSLAPFHVVFRFCCRKRRDS